MKKALINIDYTVDFVNGALPVGKPGEDIHDRLVGITRTFIENHDYLVFVIDIHKEKDVYHPETSLFPPHNIAGTAGRELYGELKALYEENQNQDHVYYMDKTRYSAFAGTDLEMRLRARGVEEVHLVGVCTDICVLHTAVDAYNKGFKIVVHSDAVASFNETGHQWALEHFKNTLGASVVTK